MKVNRFFLTKFTTFLTENYKNNSKTSDNTPKIDDKYDKISHLKFTHFWQTQRTFWQQFYHIIEIWASLSSQNRHFVRVNGYFKGFLCLPWKKGGCRAKRVEAHTNHFSETSQNNPNLIYFENFLTRLPIFKYLYGHWFILHSFHLIFNTFFHFSTCFFGNLVKFGI